MDPTPGLTNSTIGIGRVLMMNPGYLHSAGAERHCLEGVNPLGGWSAHYFLCIGVSGNYSYWCPLSSSQKKDGSTNQGVIEDRFKNGFDHFLSTNSWYDKGQIWKIENGKVLHYAAQYMNHNKESRNGNLNYVASVIVEAIFLDLYSSFGLHPDSSPELISRAMGVMKKS